MLALHAEVLAVEVVPRRCLGGVSEVSRRCLGGVSEVSRKWHARLARGAPRRVALDKPHRVAAQPPLPDPLGERGDVARAFVHIRVPRKLAVLPARVEVGAAARARRLVEGGALVGRAEDLEGSHHLLKGKVR